MLVTLQQRRTAFISNVSPAARASHFFQFPRVELSHSNETISQQVWRAGENMSLEEDGKTAKERKARRNGGIRKSEKAREREREGELRRS